MQDPLITLRAAIIADWNGNTDLDSDIDTIGGTDKEVLCSTGWYDEDFQGPQITITEITASDTPFELGYGTVRVFAIYQIDCWSPILRETGKGPGEAKKWKWQMRSEVKRIVKANLTGLTDLNYVVLDQTGRSIDELDRDVPVLRYSLQISVIYDL